VFAGRTRVGVVTSATKSPVLRAQIALARVEVGHAALGQALEIGKLDGRQKRLPAVVSPFPHYDPQKIRVRA
jgi:aminomethyltransferase